MKKIIFEILTLIIVYIFMVVIVDYYNSPNPYHYRWLEMGIIAFSVYIIITLEEHRRKKKKNKKDQSKDWFAFRQVYFKWQIDLPF